MQWIFFHDHFIITDVHPRIHFLFRLEKNCEKSKKKYRIFEKVNENFLNVDKSRQRAKI